MPGVMDPNVIDILMELEGQFAAVMVEERRWGEDPDQLVQLGEKFNAYVNFIVDGSFVAHVPEAKGRAVGIRLVCAQEPTPQVIDFLNFVHAKLSEHGVPLVVRVDEALQIVADIDRLASGAPVAVSAFERPSSDAAD